MADVKIELSGAVLSDVAKIVIFAKNKSKELATIEVKDSRPVGGGAVKIDEKEVFVAVYYKGLLYNIKEKHYLDVRIIGDGTLFIAADGHGKSRVNFRI